MMFHTTNDEQIILKVRKHWFIFFVEGVVMFFVMIIPLIIYLFLPVEGAYFPLFIFFASLWLLFSWLILFMMWTHNYLDMLVVTNKRVIDVEQRTLFSRHTSSIHLEQMEDVTVETHGVFATMMGYGDIYIQSAGEAREISIKSIPNPEEVRKLIADLYEKARATSGPGF